jgi:hypothetical protein
VPAQYIKSIVRFPRTTGLPADIVENQWVFGPDNGDVPMSPAHIAQALGIFYNVISGTQAGPISSYLNGTIDRTVDTEIASFDITGHLNGSAVGSPFDVRPLPPGLAAAGSAASLPDEVAVVLSHKSPYGGLLERGPGTRPRARVRGRVFIGPLIHDAPSVVDTTSGHAVVGSQLSNDLVQAYLGMQNYLNTVNESLAIWSRKDAALTYSTSCWVDNAFDTQRRRGELATARVSS